MFVLQIQTISFDYEDYYIYYRKSTRRVGMPPLPPLFMTYHDVSNPKKHQWYTKSKHGVLFLRSLLQLLDLYQAVLCIPPDRFQFGLGYDFRKKMFVFLYLLKCVSILGILSITDFCSYSVPELFHLQLLLSSNSFTENISKALDTKEDVQDNAKRKLFQV